MPPPPKGAAAAAAAAQKKKKKGHAPAHQNKFAFSHNPKSKLTEKILTSPNIHVCQRCYDKIEWRKQYRKYKPRTQPGTCNGCQKRNVRSAYHTICTNCTTESAKAKEIINLNNTQLGREPQQNVDNEDDDTMKDVSPPTTAATTTLTTMRTHLVRACAVCVKEIALPDPNDDNNGEEDAIAAAGRIRLRERKALERKLAKEAAAAAAAERGGDDTTSNNDNNSDSDEEHDNDTQNYGRSTAVAEHSGMSMSEIEEEDDDDPFLKAVGGADKLLTGEAYQRKLLAQLER